MNEFWSVLKQLNGSLSDCLRRFQRGVPLEAHHDRTVALIEQAVRQLPELPDPDSKLETTLMETSLCICELYLARTTVLALAGPMFDFVVRHLCLILGHLVPNKAYANKAFLSHFATILQHTTDASKVLFLNSLDMAGLEDHKEIVDYCFLVYLSLDCRGDALAELGGSTVLTTDRFRKKFEDLFVTVAKTMTRLSPVRQEFPEERASFLIPIDDHKLELRVKSTSALFHLLRFLHKTVEFFQRPVFIYFYACFFRDLVGAYVSTPSPKTSLVVIGNGCVEFENGSQTDDFFEEHPDTPRHFQATSGRHQYIFRPFLRAFDWAGFDLRASIDFLNNHFLLGFGLMKEGVFLEALRTRINGLFEDLLAKMAATVRAENAAPRSATVEGKLVGQFLRNLHNFFANYNRPKLHLYKAFLREFFTPQVLGKMHSVSFKRCEGLFDCFLTGPHFFELQPAFLFFLDRLRADLAVETDPLALKTLFAASLARQHPNPALVGFLLDFVEKSSCKLLLFVLTGFFQRLETFCGGDDFRLAFLAGLRTRLDAALNANLLFCRAILDPDRSYFRESARDPVASCLAENYRFVLESELNRLVLRPGVLFAFREKEPFGPFEKSFVFTDCSDLLLSKVNPAKCLLQNDVWNFSFFLEPAASPPAFFRDISARSLQKMVQPAPQARSLSSFESAGAIESSVPAQRKCDSFQHAWEVQNQLMENRALRSAYRPPQLGRLVNQDIQREASPVNNLFYLLRNIHGGYFERSARESRKANRFYKLNVRVSCECPVLQERAARFRSGLGQTPTGALLKLVTDHTGLPADQQAVYQFSFNQFVVFKDFSEDTRQLMLLLLTDRPLSRSQFPPYFLGNVVFVVVVEEAECHIRVAKNGVYTRTLSFEALTVPWDLLDFFTKVVVEATLNPNRIFETFSARTMTISQESIEEKMTNDLASLCV